VQAKPVRAKLQKLARAGKLAYYKDLGHEFNKPARWSEWKKILDEMSLTRPDISILVLNATSGWQGQIDYKATNGRPTEAQKKFAQI